MVCLEQKPRLQDVEGVLSLSLAGDIAAEVHGSSSEHPSIICDTVHSTWKLLGSCQFGFGFAINLLLFTVPLT